MSTYEHVVRAVFHEPWAVREETLATITALVELRVQGGRLTDEEIRGRREGAQLQAGPRGGAGRVSGSVAVVPIYGVIMPRASLMSEMSGGTSVQGITKAFRQALADESVGSIILDIDSPGGQVSGIEELAAEIRAARGQKPIVAVANYTMASAAYWIGAQADEIVASPSSMVGSIGVFLAHQEMSRAAESAGLTTTIFRKPSSKADANEWEPLTDEARADLQTRVEDAYGQFVNAVAKGRGVSAKAVRDGYGQGRVLNAQRALAAGMVDRVDTLDGTIRRLATGKAPASRAAVAADPLGPMLSPDNWGAAADEAEDLAVEKLASIAIVQPELAEDADVLADAFTAAMPDLEPVFRENAESLKAAFEDTAPDLEVRRLKARTRTH